MVASVKQFRVELTVSDLDSLTIPAKISGEFRGSMVGKFRPVYLYDGEQMSEMVLRPREDSIANSFNATFFFWKTTWGPFAREHNLERGCTLKFERMDELPTHLPGRLDRLLLDNNWVYRVKAYRNGVELLNFP
ncbi:uncharacterized protein LOC115698101 [Cannabis sativa]|uniref:uncharacterized protein LOC115698101 n=1 Tax=Cannabis sativa TaxID=3483 RepID=UPI0011DF90A2|nr:uncharacterized protein LOC115698101 [Cannabis sativa]